MKFLVIIVTTLFASEYDQSYRFEKRKDNMKSRGQILVCRMIADVPLANIHKAEHCSFVFARNKKNKTVRYEKNASFGPENIGPRALLKKGSPSLLYSYKESNGPEKEVQKRLNTRCVTWQNNVSPKQWNAMMGHFEEYQKKNLYRLFCANCCSFVINYMKSRPLNKRNTPKKLERALNFALNANVGIGTNFRNQVQDRLVSYCVKPTKNFITRLFGR